MRSAKRLWPLWAVLAAVSIWWVSQPGEGKLVIVLEGTIHPKLKLAGGASAVTTQRLPIVCRPLISLLTVPSWHSADAEGHFERLEGDRYRFTIDTAELPMGGLCRWRLAHVGVGVKQLQQSNSASLAFWPPDRRDPVAREAECYPRGNYGMSTYCDQGYGALPELPWEGEVRVPVDIHFHPEETKYVETPEG